MLKNQIIKADAIDYLRAMPDACVDAIITDPPYCRTNDAERTLRSESEYDEIVHVSGALGLVEIYFARTKIEAATQILRAVTRGASRTDAPRASEAGSADRPTRMRGEGATE